MKNKGWNKEVYRNFALVTQLGIQMVTPILLCVGLGVWLDNRFHTWFTIPLMILGVLAGGKSVYSLTMQSSREDIEEQQKRKEEQRLIEDSMEQWNRGREYGRTRDSDDK